MSEVRGSITLEGEPRTGGKCLTLPYGSISAELSRAGHLRSGEKVVQIDLLEGELRFVVEPK